jgi:hypothetical protein
MKIIKRQKAEKAKRQKKHQKSKSNYRKQFLRKNSKKR